MGLRGALSRLTRTGYAYVVLNTAVSLLAFGRNLLFMNSLGLADVGQIALMQTIVMLVGFAQAGLISGSFILWAGGDAALNRRMADVLFAAKAALAVLVALALLLAGPGILAPVVAPETLVIGLAAGVATLASTWLNNALVADQKLGLSNLVNIVAVLVSLGVALLTLASGSLTLALVSIALQPLLVALGALLAEPAARPRLARLEGATPAAMLRVGLRPFLGSLSLLLIYQIERWSIAGAMGPEALGRYYIVILYLTFFLLVPAALMNVHFPRARRALAAGESALFHRTIRRHAVELAVYAAAALVVTLLALGPVIDALLPNFAGTEPLVHLAFLGGVALLLQAPGTLVLYAVEDTRPVLAAGVIALGLFCLAMAALWAAGAFSLVAVLWARILAALAGALHLLWHRRGALARLGKTEGPA